MNKHFLRLCLAAGGMVSLLQSYVALGQGIVIGAGSHMVINGAPQVLVNNGDLVNNGNFSPSTGTVRMIGNAPSGSFIGGSNPLSFYNLTVERTAGAVTLQQDLDVTSAVNMHGNNIELNNHILNLGSTGVINNESNNSRITGISGGAVRTVAVLNSPTGANPGNIGLEITSAQNMGSTEILRSHNPEQVSTSDVSIYRYFRVNPTSNNNLDAGLRFFYFDGELNTMSESALEIWSSTDNGVDWSLYRRSTINTTDNIVTIDGFDTLSYLTLSTNNNNATPLGLTLLSFDGKLQGRQTLLNWTTVNEVGVSRFDVERSGDGKSFSFLGTVKSKGSNGADQSYSYVDGMPLTGVNYYRLKMFSEKGFSYSRTVIINTADAHTKIISVYPTPAIATVHIRMTSEIAVSGKTHVYDAAGKLAAEYMVDLKAGDQVVDIPVAQLAAGVYYIRFGGIDVDPIKIIKE